MTTEDIVEAWRLRKTRIDDAQTARTNAVKAADLEFAGALTRFVEAGGSVMEAAKAVDVHRVTLHRLMKEVT